AWILQQRGDCGGAERLLAESLEIRREALGEQHPDYVQNLVRLQTLRDERVSTDKDTRTFLSKSWAVIPREVEPSSSPPPSAVDDAPENVSEPSLELLEPTQPILPELEENEPVQATGGSENPLVDDAADSLAAENLPDLVSEAPRVAVSGPNGAA